MKFEAGCRVKALRDMSVPNANGFQEKPDIPKGHEGVIHLSPLMIQKNMPALDGAVGVAFDNGVHALVEEDNLAPV